jgi:pimeloyl-ACP methyl ester carboxylesterase
MPVNDIPSWTFPRSWAEAAKVAKEALAPREPSDEVTLDGGRPSLLKDLVAVTQFAGSGMLYKHAGKKAKKINDKFPPLADSPKVKMQDPLVIVPGWGTQPEKFDTLIEHLLASGQNGERAVYVKNGQPFVDKECTQTTTISASDKVIVAVFETTLDAPDQSAPQTEKVVEAVKAAGWEKVDVLGYSMGGLSVRKMLDNGTEKVDQVALLGTANQGTRFAALAEYIIERDIKWAMSLGGINAAHLPAMGWLKTWNPEKPESNPRLDSLNKNLDRQMAGANEFLSVASNGLATLSKSWGGHTGGDGLVPAKSATLPGMPTVYLEGKGNKHHGNLPHDSDVVATLTDYFGWERQGG